MGSPAKGNPKMAACDAENMKTEVSSSGSLPPAVGPGTAWAAGPETPETVKGLPTPQTLVPMVSPERLSSDASDLQL